MGKEIVLSTRITKGDNEILPHGMIRKSMQKSRVKSHAGALFGVLSLVGSSAATGLYVLATEVGWEHNLSMLPAFPAIALTVGALFAICESVLEGGPFPKRKIIERFVAEEYNREAIHGEAETYNNQNSRWNELRKPSMWKVLDPRRLSSNVVLSQYVHHDLKSDIYSVHTFSGSWFRTTHKCEEFPGDRALFHDIVTKKKELAK